MAELNLYGSALPVLTLRPASSGRVRTALGTLIGAGCGALLFMLLGGAAQWLGASGALSSLLPLLGLLFGAWRWGRTFSPPGHRSLRRVSVQLAGQPPLGLRLTPQDHDALARSLRRAQSGQGETLIRYLTPEAVTEFLASHIVAVSLTQP